MGRDIAATASTVLLIIGVIALLAPALFPVQQVLYHEVGAGTTANGSQLEADGYTVIAYENLSERGQAIYVSALESPEREYTVPAGTGAPEFPYEGPTDPGDTESYLAYQRLTGIVIERPGDADLPPPAEPIGRLDRERERVTEPPASKNATDSENSSQEASARAQRKQVVGTYDLVTVRKGSPPLTAPANLMRLAGVVVGTLAIGVGGYLRSRTYTGGCNKLK